MGCCMEEASGASAAVSPGTCTRPSPPAAINDKTKEPKAVIGQTLVSLQIATAVLLAPLVSVPTAAASSQHRCAATRIDGILVTRMRTDATCATVRAVAHAIFRQQIDGCQNDCRVRAMRRRWDCSGHWETGPVPADDTARLGITCNTAAGKISTLRFSYRRLYGSAD